MLKHSKRHLWLDTNLLENLKDEKGNAYALSWYLKGIRKFAIKKSKIGKDKKEEHKIYCDTFGALGEVLCEHWLDLFGHQFNITAIKDTSKSKFNRGFDFSAYSIFENGISAHIQVKMRGDEEAKFTEKSLFTMFDEAEKANLLQDYNILMVPTSNLNQEEILHWKNSFNLRYKKRFTFIGHDIISNSICRLSTSRFGNDGTLEFFTRFKEVIDFNFQGEFFNDD